MFTVILPTHKRPELVLRSVNSVLKQTYKNWQLFIVIDDPNTDYNELKTLVEGHPKVHLMQNEVNLGKNASLNKVLSILEHKSFTGKIVFLDDDDWLSSTCLAQFAEYQNYPWLVSDRFNTTTQKKLTYGPDVIKKINYLSDMLLWRNFGGETTHAISFSNISKLRFPTTIKNAEEWLYFASVSEKIGDFVYIPFTGTLSDGYLEVGLSKSHKNRREKMNILMKIFQELLQRKFVSWSIYGYVGARTIKTIIFG